jgi:1-acyl-sn-glycerol-3-phosphate acyltransferase
MQGDKVFTLNPGICRAIWLDEVPVEGYTLEDLPRLKEQVKVVMSTALEAANASWIRVNPQD